MDSQAHGWSLQGFLSLSGPLQWPWKHFLNLSENPPPHGLLHLSHLLHSPQSTETNRKVIDDTKVYLLFQ